MTYNETLEFLFSQLPAYHRIGKAAYKNNLDNTNLLDNHLGNPHRKFKTIHVAGTNGKGSISHMIASVLQEAGYKTGLYTSPHLKDFRERIRVNGVMIDENFVTRFVEKHREFLTSIEPSFFEMTVGMCFSYFEEQNVDVAVIEVGLGGRLDSTNIINPVLSVITNIGHDHMDLLGNTIEKVAIEKAGIIKPGIPVVISETSSETDFVFSNVAAANNSPITFADKQFFCRLDEPDKSDYSRHFIVSDSVGNEIAHGITPLGGDYQKFNIQAVFSAFNVCGEKFNIDITNVVNGIRNIIRNTSLMGRWQVIGHKPLTICDTGHNREGIVQVMGQIQTVKKDKLHIVIGFVNDKDLSSVLPLFPKDAVYYFTKASIPRALEETALKSQAELYGLHGRCFASVAKALEAARNEASESDLIYVGGSTFIVAEAV